MSKTTGFRNSGKLDLGGKNMEYVLAGVLFIIIVASIVLSVGALKCGGGSAGPTGKPRVKCTECKEEWEIGPEDVRKFEREMERERERGVAPVGADCDKCGKKECVFRMSQCPKCKKYYLSKRITDYEAFVEDGKKEICPHCGTDLHKWYREHPRH